MFDTSSVSNKQIVNSVSGTLVKSHPKSYFVLGHVDSRNTESLMWSGCSRVVLQAMLVGDKYLMYEVVDRGDYDQTAKRVMTSNPETDGATGRCNCGACGKSIDPSDNYCRCCGSRLED